MPQSPAWPRRCVYRFGKSIQRGRKDIDRRIAEAEAQNGGGLSKPSTVTDLKIRRWESRPKAGNSQPHQKRSGSGEGSTALRHWHLASVCFISSGSSRSTLA
jgi:hypothetical protein